MPSYQYSDDEDDSENYDAIASSNDEVSDDEEDANQDSDDVDEEVMNRGRVAPSDDDDMDFEQPVDIEPAKPEKKKKTTKARVIADASPKPLPSLKKTKQSKPSRPKATPPVPSSAQKLPGDVVDVSTYEVGKIFKATVKPENQESGYILKQPNTTPSRIDTKEKANIINQKLSELIKSGKVTRDNCVKLVTIHTSGEDAVFLYTFGVWSKQGRVVPFKTHHAGQLLTADLSSKGSTQTPKKWVTDKKNMMDPESYHVIKHKGVSYNVPMPITSTDHNASLANEQNRTVRKNTKHKQATIDKMCQKMPLVKPQAPPPSLPKQPEKVQTPPKPSSPKRKRDESCNTDEDAPIRNWLKKVVKPDGHSKRVCVAMEGGKTSWIVTLNAETIPFF